MISKEIKCNIGISKIHGIGVFAIRDIKKGESLFPISKTHLLLKELDNIALKQVLDRNVIYNNTKEVDHPSLEVNYTAFMNHSNTPNSNGIFALTNIKTGEEITEDYRHPNMAGISKKHFDFL